MKALRDTSWQLTVRGRVIGLLASLAALAAALTGDAHARFAGALLGGALLVDLVLKLAPTRIWLMPGSRQVEAGPAFVETIEIENRGPWTLLDFRLAEPRTMTAAGGALIRMLAPHTRLTLSLPSRARTRGRFATRILACELLWPFALVRKKVNIAVETQLVVEPARLDLPDHLRDSIDARIHDPEAVERVGTSDFWMLRELAEGEDIRHVHALRSAATGTLVRRIERGTQSRHAWIVLDLRRARGRMNHGSRRFEWSLSAAATLADDLEQRGVHFTCLVLGSTPRLIDLRTDGERQELLGFLAGAQPEDHCQVDLSAWPELQATPLCLWIPAGGARASAERSALPEAILVTSENER